MYFFEEYNGIAVQPFKSTKYEAYTRHDHRRIETNWKLVKIYMKAWKCLGWFIEITIRTGKKK